MNIGERATVIAHTQPRERVLADAERVLLELAYVSVDELVTGEQVAKLVAAAMLKTVVNGSAPRVVTRVLDDGVTLRDRTG